MGQEARCTVRFGEKVSEGKALLETDVLIFRGDFRLSIPFKDIETVEDRDGELTVAFSDGVAVFTLGLQAPRWADRIRNPKQLIDKLGVKPDSQVVVLDVADDGFWKQLRDRIGDVAPDVLHGERDVIFVGVETIGALDRLSVLRRHMKKNGAIWVVAPKGKSGVRESDVLAAGRAAGLVDTKVVAFSATHTAHRFVLPRDRR